MHHHNHHHGRRRPDLYRELRHSLAARGAVGPEELDLLKAYLEIEKARFGAKLQVETRVALQAETVRIPPMLLQPLVENAIKHGVSPKLEGGRISICAACENGVLELEIADDGVGFDSSTAKRLYHDGVGVKNVHDRLKVLYGENARFQIQSTPGSGTTVRITMPAQVREK